MGTSACQRDLKVWDVRQLCGPLQSYKLVGGSASDLAFSQSGLLAASCANTVQVNITFLYITLNITFNLIKNVNNKTKLRVVTFRLYLVTIDLL